MAAMEWETKQVYSALDHCWATDNLLMAAMEWETKQVYSVLPLPLDYF